MADTQQQQPEGRKVLHPDAGKGRLRAAIARSAPPGWRLALAAFGAGVLAATGQAPMGLWAGAVVGYGALVWLVGAAAGPGRAAWLAWLGGGGHFMAALFWIVEPFLVDPLRHGWMAPFALPGLAFGLALFWAFAGWLAGRLATGPRSMALGFAVALAAAELARGHLLTGFPWAQAGHVWLDTGVMQLAAVVGASGLTAATLLLAAVPALARDAGPRWRAGAAVVPLLGVALAWGWGAARAPAPMPEGTPVVRLIQPNVPQHLKWHPDLMQRWFDRQMDFTAAAPVADAARPDLVIWPETAIHWLLEDAWPALAAIAAAADGAKVALGAQRAERPAIGRNGESTRYFNSLALIDPDGAVRQVYDKHHLVPFGEYIPFSEWLMGTPLGGLAGRSLLGFSPGPGPVVWDLGALGRVAPQICYETVFPGHLHLTPRPDWVLQVTNDAWFGAIAGPYQHLAQARFRAVEFGLPVVRVANTGVSAVIDARGGLVAALALNTEGWADVALPGPLPATIFARRGETPLAGLLIVVLVLLLRNRLRRRH